MPINPTSETYQTLNSAYDFFNRQLFDSKLPNCLITMQRKGKARGYFCPERFETREEDKHFTHEIALNPAYFNDRTDKDILSTLVHEMVHLWQQENGKPSRGNYHNGEWADRMEDIGLIPSNTGEEGGSRTGTGMSHYIDDDGRYLRLAEAFLECNPPIQFQDRPEFKSSAKSKKNKVKYSCPVCKLNAWGKSGINLMCGKDREMLIEEEK